MLKALSKQRTPNELLLIHMKFVLLSGVILLLWTNTSARTIISDGLYNASEIVRPD